MQILYLATIYFSSFPIAQGIFVIKNVFAHAIPIILLCFVTISFLWIQCKSHFLPNSIHYIKLTSYNIQLQYINMSHYCTVLNTMCFIITPMYLKYILDVQNQIKKSFLKLKKKFLTFSLNDVFQFVHFTFKALFPSSFG